VITKSTIRSMGIAPARSWKDPESHWVSWVDRGDGAAWGEQRVKVPPHVWERMKIGDPIELITVAGSRGFHLREGIYAEDSQFAFDIGLLIAGFLGSWWMMAQILSLQRKQELPAEEEVDDITHRFSEEG
jgi:hypothetical protein